MTGVKICGITTPDALEAAIEGRARFIGFAFYSSSSRFIQADVAWELARRIPAGVRSVGLFVNPTDDVLDRFMGRVPLDMLQLHGEETPQRVAEIRLRTEMPVIKAIAVSQAQDVSNAKAYQESADWLLFDTKAPAGAYGGTGQVFDWGLLAGQTFARPWMLSGGLTAENVGAALTLLKPDAVDVSSGVEVSRGVKDGAKIKAFIAAVNAV